MNKVVTREMRAGDLPQAIRGDIDPASAVRVTVEEIAARPATGHFDVSHDSFATMDEILAHVRAVRDGVEAEKP